MSEVAADDDDKPNDEIIANDQHDDESEKSAAVPENGDAVKPMSDADGTADGAVSHNGPAVIPSTSVDAVVATAKADKEEKAKKEKPKTVGILELVNFSRLLHFWCKHL